MPDLPEEALREVCLRFISRLQRSGKVQWYTGSGIVEGFTISRPDWRFVIDTREPPLPGQAFIVHVDPSPSLKVDVEIITDGETLDRAFRGELHVRTAMDQGLIRIDGDVNWAIRLIPALLTVIPIYREIRKAFVAESR